MNYPLYTSTDNFSELSDWISEYARWGNFPVSPLQRFSIGTYQIGQALKWKGEDSANESWAASALHFIACIRLMNSGIAQDVPRKLTEFVQATYDPACHMLDLVLAQQIVFYGNSAVKSRAQRFSEKKLITVMGKLIRRTIWIIPREKRVAAFTHAIAVLTNEIGKEN